MTSKSLHNNKFFGSTLMHVIGRLRSCPSSRCDSIINESVKLGYVKQAFPELRSFLIEKNGLYNLDIVFGLMDAVLNCDLVSNCDSVNPTDTNKKDSLYDKNIIEYVNVRALGLDNSLHTNKTTGSFLDMIVYMLQTRSEVIHLAPFFECWQHQIHSPKDLLSISSDLVSPQLLEIGLNPADQLRLILEFGYYRKKQILFMLDVLPHTAHYSIDYLHNPFIARWVQLDALKIKQNKVLYKKGQQIIKDLNSIDICNYLEEDIKSIFSLDLSKIATIRDITELKDVLYNALIKTTCIVSSKKEKDILRRRAVSNWKKSICASNLDLIYSADSVKVAKKVQEIVYDKLLFNSNSLRDSIRANYEHIVKTLKLDYLIYNLPVGAYDGGVLEIVGYDLRLNQPVYVCKKVALNDRSRELKRKNIDVSKNIFYSISRFCFRFEDASVNFNALQNFIDIYLYWLDFGFTSLRLDQADHIFYDTFPERLDSLGDFLATQKYQHDALISKDINTIINALAKDKSLNSITENMMHSSLSELLNVYNEMRQIRANGIIGNFQFIYSLLWLLSSINTSNYFRQLNCFDQFLLNTIEFHDNDLTHGGSSPVCRSVDGLLNFRIRLLLCSLGLPYITSQGINAINYHKLRDISIKKSIMKPINLNFQKDITYIIGGKTSYFEDYKNNLFDFIDIKVVKQLMKYGKISIIYPAKITEKTAKSILCFTVINENSDCIIFLINTSNTSKKNVSISYNVMIDFLYDYLFSFNLDKEDLEKSRIPLSSIFNKDNMSIELPILHPGEIKIYLFSKEYC